jgi:hypothetical protein
MQFTSIYPNYLAYRALESAWDGGTPNFCSHGQSKRISQDTTVEIVLRLSGSHNQKSKLLHINNIRIERILNSKIEMRSSVTTKWAVQSFTTNFD